MKKIALFGVLLASLACMKAQAQSQENEVKLNFLNALAISSVEIGYERLLDDHQSVAVDLFFNDRFSYAYPFSSKKKFSAFSIAAGYNYYIGDEDNNPNSGIVISPFLKLRFGKYTETKSDDTKVKTSLNSFILGVGVGYKWVFNDVFTVNPFVNIARNFGSEVNDKFMAIEPNAGVSIGYRF